MQVLSLSRRALGCAALLTPTAVLLSSATQPVWAQQPQQARPPITMTLDSPLASPMSGSNFSDGDARFDSGVNPDGTRAKPLSVVTRFGRWFPVAVNLTNSGDDAAVTLSMRLLSTGNEAPGSVSSFEQQVNLPRNSRKRVWMYGRLERGGCDAGQISLAGRGVSSLSRSFALASPSEGARVVWSISDTDKGGNLNFLSGLPQLRAKTNSTNGQSNYGQVPAAQNSDGRAVEALSANHELVPSRWIGLDGVDLVVLRDFAHNTLSTEQQSALKGYVAAGGTMLVLGGSNLPRLAASPLSEMWPVDPSAARPASQVQTGSLVSLLRSELHRVNALRLHGVPVDLPLNLSGPRTLDEADKLGGAPLLLIKGALAPTARPLTPALPAEMAAVRSYGAGRVEWLGFDPTQAPLLDWRGQEALWKPIMNKLGRPRRIEGVDSRLETPGATSSNDYSYNSSAQTDDTLLSSLRAALSRSPQLRTPAASSIAWFLALYVFFLVPVNYVVLRSVDRRELAWITVPVIVLAFSTLSYAAAVRIKGTDLRAREVALVQGSDASPLARADSMLWVFSPRKASYSIEGRDAQGQPDASMVSAVYADGRRSDALDNSLVRISDQAGLSVDGAPINMWDYKSFVGHSVVPSSAGFKLEQSGGKTFVVNNSGQALRAAAWVEKGRIIPLGDMAPGARVDLNRGSQSSAGGSAALAEMAAPVYNFDNAGTGRDIAAAALSVAGVDTSRHADGVYPAPTLVAWQTRPSSALVIQGEAPVREAVTLWLWRFSK